MIALSYGISKNFYVLNLQEWFFWNRKAVLIIGFFTSKFLYHRIESCPWYKISCGSWRVIFELLPKSSFIFDCLLENWKIFFRLPTYSINSLSVRVYLRCRFYRINTFYVKLSIWRATDIRIIIRRANFYRRNIRIIIFLLSTKTLFCFYRVSYQTIL